MNLKTNKIYTDHANLGLSNIILGVLVRWSLIAGRIPGRTDNEIKNYWNTHLKHRLRGMGIDPMIYHVGLTLLPLLPYPEQQDPHHKRPKVSTSSKDLHTATAHHVKVSANHPGDQLLHADQRQRRVFSPETSSSSSGSRSATLSSLYHLSESPVLLPQVQKI